MAVKSSIIMVTNLTQPGYVNNYDKNRHLEIFSKAAVQSVSRLFVLILDHAKTLHRTDKF